MCPFKNRMARTAIPDLNSLWSSTLSVTRGTFYLGKQPVESHVVTVPATTGSREAK